MIVRGAFNAPFSFGSFSDPSRTKLVQFRHNVTLNPLEYLAIANVSSGCGTFFMHSIAVQSGNENFLEGCHRMFSPPHEPFPGVQLSTGTEDYFDSGYGGVERIE